MTAAPQQPFDREPPLGASGQAAPLRVLVVEDDPLNARIILKLLKKLGGCDAQHTEAVAVILDLVSNGQVDIILMDVSLTQTWYKGEKMDGVRLTNMVKALDAHLPVILVTAHAMKGDMEYFLQESGADGYIAKPIVDPQSFIAQVWHLGKRGRDA